MPNPGADARHGSPRVKERYAAFLLPPRNFCGHSKRLRISLLSKVASERLRSVSCLFGRCLPSVWENLDAQISFGGDPRRVEPQMIFISFFPYLCFLNFYNEHLLRFS